MPIIQPIKAGPAPREMAKGVRIGYCACKSKNARKRNRYSHSAVFTGKHLREPPTIKINAGRRILRRSNLSNYLYFTWDREGLYRFFNSYKQVYLSLAVEP